MFNEFGIIPYILEFCNATNHTFEEAMTYDVSTLFYIVTYQVLRLREQEKRLKEASKKYNK